VRLIRLDEGERLAGVEGVGLLATEEGEVVDETAVLPSADEAGESPTTH